MLWVHNELKEHDMVRMIGRKLSDIAEAGWDHGDAASREDDDYGQYGEIAERRITRLADQIRQLALVAITGRYQLGAEGVTELETHPRLETILASALIADWATVETALSNAIAGSRVGVVPTPHVELNEVQHCAEGLTVEETGAAYAALTEHFGLRHQQRSRLDRSPQYSAALNAAHRGDWPAADRALSHGHIIF